MNSTKSANDVKRAILYTRVSTDEQAQGFSLRAQEERLRTHCEREGIEVIAHYQDDASAKTFVRPEFQKLLAFLRKNRGAVNTLLVVKWDRFSRNATDAYGMIRELDKLGVAVEAIEQRLDFAVPENKLMLAFYLAAPEVENDRRSLNVTSGMRRAMKEGRWVAVAPKGYRNGRDDVGKPHLVPGKDADLIRDAFSEMATGLYGMEEVRQRLSKKGFVCSKNQFTLLLRNPVYVGKIRVKGWKEEPESIVKGSHEALVNELIFERVQSVLDARTNRGRGRPSQARDELPLRGFLLCRKCGGNLTGSASRGHGGKYHYYHCQKGCAERFLAKRANDGFENYLSEIRVAPEVAELYANILEDVYRANNTDRKREQQRVTQELGALEDRLLAVDEKFVEGALDRESYQRLKVKYERTGTLLRLRREELRGVGENIMPQIRFAFSLVTRLPECYRKSPLEIKRKIIGSIFPEKLIWENGKYRTSRMNEVVRLLQGKRGEFEDIKKDWLAGKRTSPATWTQ